LPIKGYIALTKSLTGHQGYDHMNKLDRLLSDYRLFWNYRKLSIYFEQGYKFDLDAAGLKNHVQKTMKIVDTLYESIKGRFNQ